MINKKILNKFKAFLIGEKFKVGDKYFYFEGCDLVEIKFSHKIQLEKYSNAVKIYATECSGTPRALYCIWKNLEMR